MKKVEEEHRCILVQHKEAKCEVERLKGELVEAFSKVKFIELEIIQANVKVECISTKKLDTMPSSQKSSHDKTSLGYTREGSSSSEPKKEVRFVLAKNDEKLKEVKLEIDTPTVVKRTIGARLKKIGKSLSKNQRGPQMKHVCHHCGIQGHTRPNCFKLHALKRADSMHGQESSKRRPREYKLREIVKDISLEPLWKC